MNSNLIFKLMFEHNSDANFTFHLKKNVKLCRIILALKKVFLHVFCFFVLFCFSSLRIAVLPSQCPLLETKADEYVSLHFTVA